MNDNNNNTSKSTGIGFLGLLTIIFVIAKITHFINWSWWLVFSPVLAPTILLIGVAIVGWTYIGILKWLNHRS